MNRRQEFRDPMKPNLFQLLGFVPRDHSVFFHGLTEEQIDEAVSGMKKQAENLAGKGLSQDRLQEEVEEYKINALTHALAYKAEENLQREIEVLLGEWKRADDNPFVTVDQMAELKKTIKQDLTEFFRLQKEGEETNENLGVLAKEHSTSLPAAIKEVQNI